MIVRSTFYASGLDPSRAARARVSKYRVPSCQRCATAPSANYPTHPHLRLIPSSPYSRILGFETESSGPLHLGYKIFLYSTGYQP